MIEAGGMDKRKDRRAAEKTRQVQQGWNWSQKTDRRRRALDDKNYDKNKADKGRTEVAVERQHRNGSIESNIRITPLSSARDPSYFAFQLSLFGGGGAVGNSFGVRVVGGIVGGGECGGLSDIILAVQMDQSPLYTYQGCGGGGGSSGDGGLEGRGRMCPRRRGG